MCCGVAVAPQSALQDIDWCFFQLQDELSSYPVSLFCLPAEIEKCEGDELRKDGDMKKYLDIISNKNIKLSERVLIPIQQYPKVRDTMATPYTWPLTTRTRTAKQDGRI